MHVIRVSCNEEYDLKGEETMRCQDGAWSISEVPACIQQGRWSTDTSVATIIYRGAEAGGMGGIYPPIFQIFANFRSKIPSEG